MKIATVVNVKKELRELSHSELVLVCLRLAKSKKENKELLNYLLFESSDEDRYIKIVKGEIATGFQSLNTTNFYLAKKTIRKVLRLTNKHISFSKNKETEVELLLNFCEKFNSIDLYMEESKTMVNLYNNVLKKINKAIITLHEDLQYDYEKRVQALNVYVQ